MSVSRGQLPKAFACLLLYACASVLASPRAEARWTTAEAPTDGERLTVEIWSNRDVPAELAEQAIAEYGRVRRITDTTDPQSEISLVNAHAAANAVEVGAELFVFVDLALDIAARTNGVVDPTSSVPVFSNDPLSANDNRARRNYRDVILDREHSTIRFAAPDVRLDAGFLARTHALAATCEWLRVNGVKHARIATGGVVCYVGDRRGKDWSHGVGTPGVLQRKVVRLSVTDAAVVSVGDITIYKEGDVEFTVLPTAGPEGQPVRSATVFGRNAMIAAGLAYMIFVRGPVLGFENLLAYPEYEAFVFDRSGEVAHTFGVDMMYSDR